MRAEAGGSAIVAFQKPGPGLRQAEAVAACGPSAQCRRSRDQIRCRPLRQQVHELVESRDFGRAGPRKLLADRGPCCFVRSTGPSVPARGSDTPPSCLIRIDVHGRKVRDARHWRRQRTKPDSQHFVKVGGRIGADQQHSPARIRKSERRHAAQRRLPDTTLAGEEEKPGRIGRRRRVQTLQYPSPCLQTLSGTKGICP